MNSQNSQIAEDGRRAQAPPPGVDVAGSVALAPDNGQTIPADAPSRIDPGLQLAPSKSGSKNPPCSGTKKNGAPCGMRVTLEVILADQTRTWRCRQHRDKTMTPVKETVRVPQPPVTMLKTKADAERFLQWLLKSAVTKAYNAAEIKGILMIVARWDRVRQREEQAQFDAMRALYERMKAEVKAVRDSIKAGHGGDEDDDLGGRADKLEELIACWRQEFTARKREAA
jgi:hypothetical protein